MNEFEQPQRYDLKITSEIFVQARILGIDHEEMVEFFATQIECMFRCKPNYNYFGQKAKVWILRGFYPGSSLFFKLILLAQRNQDLNGNDMHDGGYFAKVTTLTINNTKKKRAFQIFSGHSLREQMTDKMENALMGAKHEFKPLMTDKYRLPRCISPSGMPIYRFKKPSKRKRKSETKSN